VMAVRTRLTRPRPTWRAPLGLLLVWALALATARADEPATRVPNLSEGRRVRVTAVEAIGQSSRPSIRGTLVELGPDRLVVSIPDDFRGVPVQFPLPTISKIEVSRGYRRHVGVGAVVGFVAGAAVGALLTRGRPGVSCAVPPNPCGVDSTAPVAVGFGLAFGSVGALVGHGIRTEQWSRVALPALPDPAVDLVGPLLLGRPERRVFLGP
jgi:hypothetical protein